MKKLARKNDNWNVLGYVWRWLVLGEEIKND